MFEIVFVSGLMNETEAVHQELGDDFVVEFVVEFLYQLKLQMIVSARLNVVNFASYWIGGIENVSEKLVLKKLKELVHEVDGQVGHSFGHQFVYRHFSVPYLQPVDLVEGIYLVKDVVNVGIEFVKTLSAGENEPLKSMLK